MGKLSDQLEIPETFADPLTGQCPTNENELSALLAVFHNRQRIDWSKVSLYSVDGNAVATAADIFGAPGSIYTEYPLFAGDDQRQIDIWGQMRADLAYLSSDGGLVCIVENKVGSGFTGNRKDPSKSQLARMLDHLQSLPGATGPKRRILILLSTARLFGKNWYTDELRSAARGRSTLEVYRMNWEDVFVSLRPG